MTLNRLNTPTIQRAALIMLVVGWLSMWGAWIPSPVVGLRLNAFDLAEWGTVLMPVRLGEMRYIPDLLRLALALCTIALALKAGDVSRLWVRWGLRALMLIGFVILMPQYPFWLASEHRMRLIVAIAALIGIALSFLVDRREGIRWGLISVLLSASLGIAIYSFNGLSAQFSTHYGSVIQPGWGLLLFGLMLVIAALIELNASFWLLLVSTVKRTPEKQNGPAS